MVYKRPFHDEGSYEVGRKHPRQQGHPAQQSPTLGIAHCSDSPQKLEESYEVVFKHPRQQEDIAQQSSTMEITHCNESPHKVFSDEGENSIRNTHCGGKIAVGEGIDEDLNETNQEVETNPSGSIPRCLWVNGNTINEYAESEAAMHLSFFPHYFELDHLVTTLVQPRGIYSFLLDHPPRKLVAVGVDHQADIPQWAPQGLSKSFGCLDESDAQTVLAESSGSSIVNNDDNGLKWLGTCVIPMPDMESPSYNCCTSGETRSFCNCSDKGSVGCVRQHVLEAREELRENLGQKMFEELGFCDMGEEVANKWSEEEEQIFHEVVQMNAPTLGKNFWDYLPAVFPSRTRKDLVNYYFNVFMLRKRAEQNRFGHLNIDSDNDECERIDIGIAEDDEDSVVESLDQEIHEDELLEGIDNGYLDTCRSGADSTSHRYVMGEEGYGDGDGIPPALDGNFAGDCSIAHNQEILEYELLEGTDKGDPDTCKNGADSMNHIYVAGEEDQGDIDGIPAASDGNSVGDCSIALNREIHEDELLEGADKGDPDTFRNGADSLNHRYVMGKEGQEDIDGIPAAGNGNFAGDCSTGPDFQLPGKISSNNGEDHDM